MAATSATWGTHGVRCATLAGASCSVVVTAGTVATPNAEGEASRPALDDRAAGVSGRSVAGQRDLSGAGRTPTAAADTAAATDTAAAADTAVS